jgi:hypothetical protein
MYPTSMRSATRMGNAAGLPSGAVAAVGGRFCTAMSPRGRNMTSGFGLRNPMRRTNCMGDKQGSQLDMAAATVKSHSGEKSVAAVSIHWCAHYAARADAQGPYFYMRSTVCRAHRVVRRQRVRVGHELHDEGRLRRRLQLLRRPRLLHDAAVEDHDLVRYVKRLLLRNQQQWLPVSLPKYCSPQQCRSICVWSGPGTTQPPCHRSQTYMRRLRVICPSLWDRALGAHICDPL